MGMLRKMSPCPPTTALVVQALPFRANLCSSVVSIGCLKAHDVPSGGRPLARTLTVAVRYARSSTHCSAQQAFRICFFLDQGSAGDRYGLSEAGPPVHAGQTKLWPRPRKERRG